MKRRDFLRYGTYSLAFLALGDGVIVPKVFKRSQAFANAKASNIEFTMKEVMAEMVDKTLVPMWSFADNHHGPRIPGSTIFANEGEIITLKLTNEMDEPHGFAIPGVVTSTDLLPGQSKTLSFSAPSAGTYMYFDPLNDPINRVMGLHGTLVVQPTGSNNTPFGNPTVEVQQIFDALGTRGDVPTIFPGDPWTPERTMIWLMNTIDPGKN